MKTAARAFFFLFSVACGSGSIAQSVSAPPKSIKDLIAQVDAAKPNPERVAQLKRELEAAVPADAPRQSQIAMLRKQAHAAEELGQTGRELELRRKIAELARGTENAARMLMDLAVKERLFGDYSASMRLVDEVIKLAPNPAWLIATEARVAVDRASMGDTAAADQAMRKAEQAYGTAMATMSRAAGWYRHLWLNQLECLRGNYQLARGRLSEADAAYRKAVDAAIEDLKLSAGRQSAFGLDAPGPDTSHALRDACESGWAVTLMQQRRFVEAEILMRNQVERVVARVGRDSPQVASAVGTLGSIYARQGRYVDAEALLAEAVKIFERVGAEDGSTFVGRIRGEYAQALYVRGAYAEAIAQVDRWKGEPERNGGAGTTHVISLVRTAQGARALAAAEAFLPRAEQRYGADHAFVGQAKGAKAMALKALGRRNEALPLFREAVRGIADARRRSGSEGLESLAQRIFGAILEDYLLLLSEMQAPEYASLFKEAPAVEGFAAADLLRAGSVQRALAASSARASADKELAEAVRREQDAGEEISSLLRTLSSLLAAPPEQRLTKVIGDMQARITTLKAEQVRMSTDVERRFPAYANLIAPQPPTVAQTQAALRADESLLAVLSGEQATFIWALPKSGSLVFHAAPLARKELERLTGQVRRTVDPFAHGMADVPPFALNEAYAIYRQVLLPVLKGFEGAKSLIVTTNGALAALPFALLPMQPSEVRIEEGVMYSAYRKVPWMAKSFAISQVPSVNALVTLRALPARTAVSNTFVGIGDPFFSKAQMTEAAGAGATVAVRGGMRVSLRSAGRLDQVDSAELGRLARLPDTADEIKEIAAILGADSQVYLQLRANEKEVKTRDWRDRRIVMFATHGLVPGELDGLNQPALALTAPEVAGVDGDGLLTVEEILNLKLDADWVVLSACNTASGSAEGAEALSGLGRAFFYAGTRALLASNWPVETVSAKLMTTGIFKRQAAQAGLSKSEALRSTMLNLMDTGEAKDGAGNAAYSYAHPLFWAPFALVGDGR